MNFSQVLHTAQKNHTTSSNRVKYYSTKYEAPKKMKKESKQLSENIKKFLAKKEEEERNKIRNESRKKEELLALRAQDKKATRRVNVMLKRTKSANQSVIEDAVDKTHTAVTRSGTEQPDEDDYGYVSHEASAFYEKMMEKYSKIPEEPKFNTFKKKGSTNLNYTKDRVKAALEREKEEALNPHRRKRKRKEHGDDNDDDNSQDVTARRTDESQIHNKDNDIRPTKIRPKVTAPPPLSFAELLKVAAKKQHEPILIEQKPKEEERLLTKRQRKEMEREKESKERREARYKMENAAEKNGSKNDDIKSNVNNNNNNVKMGEKQSNSILKTALKSSTKESSASNHQKLNGSSFDSNRDLKNDINRKFKDNVSQNNRTINSNPFKQQQHQVGHAKLADKKQFPPKDLMMKNKAKPTSLNMQQKSKQFPPPDRGNVKRNPPVVANKGRIIDDSDEEYDSELDDFIDDGPLDEQDYTSAIKEIFGYDKSKYRDVDDDVDNMESTFAQQMKEEVISTKIGIMEDLEDIKLEEQLRKQKMQRKRKY